MVTTTLKLRADLQSAEVVDADGVLYYDVTDPRTGGVLRLFDYEWLIAQRLDGQRGFDELARWTEEQFGFAASRDDLQVYAERLQQLGMVEGAPAVGAKPLPAALYAASALKVLGALSGPVKPTAAALPTPPVAPAPLPAPTPEPARPIAASKPPLATVQRPAEKPPEPVERRASRDEDAVMGQQILPTRPTPAPLAQPQRPTPVAVPVQTPISAPVQAPIAAPVQAPIAAPVQAPSSGPVQTPAAAAPLPAEPAPPSQPQRLKSDMLEAIEALPPPVEEPPVETRPAPVELVQPPAAQPEPVAAVVSAPVSAAEPSAPTVAPAQIPIEQEPVARPVETPAAAPPLAAEPAPAERPVMPVVELVKPSQPVSPQPVAAPTERPMPLMPQPVVKTTTTPEKPSGAGKWFVILVILAVLAVVAYYFLALNQQQPPPAVSVNVSIAKPEDVTRSFAAAAVVKSAEPQPLKIEGDGTVTKVVAENTEVQPDTVLVELDTQSKLAKELTELHERLNFYQKKLDSAKNKGKAEQLRDAQQKISEKQQRLEQVEALVKKSQLMAPRSGAVSKVMVKVGQAVTAGTEVVSLTDKALAAEIKIPAIEAQGMKVGQDAQLSSSAGALTARVAALRTEGDYAMVQYSLPENAAAKPGDELKLQKAPLSQVVRLPTAALLEGSKVFVLRDGKAATVPVTVADREGDAVLLQGLPSGEQVIVSHPTELHEGTPVRVSPAGSQ